MQQRSVQVQQPLMITAMQHKITSPQPITNVIQVALPMQYMVATNVTSTTTINAIVYCLGVLEKLLQTVWQIQILVHFVELNVCLIF